MEQSDLYRGMYNIHDLHPCGTVSQKNNREICNLVANNAGLRAKLAMADKITGKQSHVFAVLYGRNDGGDAVPKDSELEMQEKIMKEKQRMVNG